ncbi:hypothetical protein V8C44DRAFT_342417 [Trichoderma aethiopicum]
MLSFLKGWYYFRAYIQGRKRLALVILVSCYFRVLLRNLLSALWVGCIMAPLPDGETLNREKTGSWFRCERNGWGCLLCEGFGVVVHSGA